MLPLFAATASATSTPGCAIAELVAPHDQAAGVPLDARIALDVDHQDPCDDGSELPSGVLLGPEGEIASTTRVLGFAEIGRDQLIVDPEADLAPGTEVQVEVERGGTYRLWVGRFTTGDALTPGLDPVAPDVELLGAWDQGHGVWWLELRADHPSAAPGGWFSARADDAPPDRPGSTWDATRPSWAGRFEHQGPTLDLEVTYVDPVGERSAPATLVVDRDQVPGSGCGCATGSPAQAWVALAALVLRRRARSG